MSEKKRENKHRVTVYLNDNAYQGLQSYVTANYSTMNSYGAISQTINNAVSYYCEKQEIYPPEYYTKPIKKLEEKQLNV